MYRGFSNLAKYLLLKRRLVSGCTVLHFHEIGSPPLVSPKQIQPLVSVAAHLRGMRPAPTSQKDTLMLRENLKL